MVPNWEVNSLISCFCTRVHPSSKANVTAMPRCLRVPETFRSLQSSWNCRSVESSTTMMKKQRRRMLTLLLRLWEMVLLLLLLLLGGECHGESRALSFEDTLADDVRAAVATRCDNLDQRRERLKCVLTCALDSVGPATVKDSSSPSPSVPPESCKYRSEGGHGRRLHKYATPPSEALDSLLQSYDAMHRRCTATPLNLTTNSWNSSSEACKCKYLIWGHGGFGLGNRLLSLVSAFVYALLSQRTLLLSFAEWPSLFCSPFPNSPYFTLNDPNLNHNRDGVYYQSFRAMGCGADENRRCADVGMVNLALHHDTTAEEHEFLVCPSGYASLRNVPVVTAMFSNQFYAAAFAANPVLHDAFHLLFPGSDPFHSVARSLFAPADALWSEISQRLRLAAACGADGAPARRFGVQLREFGGGYTPAFDAAAAACLRRYAALCPGNGSSSSAVAVYVASLDRRHVRGLRRALSGGVRGRRADVAWHPPAMDEREGFDGVHLREAAADMWSLSAADVLVTTPRSTFGYVAHGLAGVRPLHLSAEACVGGVSYEPCFHFAPTSATVCTGDGGAFASALAKSSGLVASCPDFPGSGWQLIPPPT